jgi:hypothetical protein
MVALGQRVDHKCPCGRDLRHRGSCQFRQNYRNVKEHANDESARPTMILRRQHS